MDFVRHLFQELPLIGRFAVIFGLVVLLPRVAERISLPGVVALLLGGIVLGPEFLGLLSPTGGAIPIFAELGKLLLMFYAGYEVDIEQFKRVRWRSAGYGLLTFAVPLCLGGAAAWYFGYGPNASLLVGSLLASHTLLALPILKQFDLMGRDSVVVTIAATMLTDIAALLVLAICVPMHQTGFSREQLAVQLIELAIYVPLVIFGLGGLVRWINGFVKPNSPTSLAIFLLMIAVAALAAEAINLEGIVGAFLTGIAVKRALGHSQTGNTLEIISHTLFIPVFFLSTGFLVQVATLARTLTSDFAFVAATVGALFVGKYVAAQIFGVLSRTPTDDRLLMCSLSVPQVAATLAAAFAAYGAVNAAGQRLIDDRVINVIIVLILVTAVAGPVLTRLFAKRIQQGRQTGPIDGVHPADGNRTT